MQEIPQAQLRAGIYTASTARKAIKENLRRDWSLVTHNNIISSFSMQILFYSTFTKLLKLYPKLTKKALVSVSSPQGKSHLSYA